MNKNKNRLTCVSGTSFFCLLASCGSWGTLSAIAGTTETLNLESTTIALDYSLPSVDFTIPAQIADNNSPVDFTIPAQILDSNFPDSSPVEQVNSVAQIPQSSSPDSSSMEQVNSVSQLSESMGQVNSVSQLSDVQPGDWAYEALRSLVERYGCIAGYPDGTFRGSSAMTRYEFAAGLNACMQVIERLIASNTNSINGEDLTVLQRLVDDFEVELTTLGVRVDKLEGRVASLEEDQFSTTTKLSGEAIFSIVGATGGDKDDSDGVAGDDPNIILVNRVRLNLTTSFTGKDALITGLQADNFGGAVDGSGSIQNTLFPGASFLSAGSTKLSFEPQFPRFNPQDLSAIDSNSIGLYKLLYVFPAPGVKNLTLFAGTAAEVSDAFPTIVPFSSEGQGAISRFASLNPVARISGGTSQRGLASPVGFIWKISERVDLRALYGSVNAAIPSQEDNNVLGAGFFGGSTVAAAQLTLNPTDSIDLGINYAHSYHDLNIMALGLTSFSSEPLFIPGSDPFNTPVHINSVGATVAWRLSPKVTLTGYGSYFFVDAVAGPDASSNFSSWMAGLYFKDVLKDGNTAGLLFGQPLHRVNADGAAELSKPGVDRATPYHLEAFYNFKLNDRLSVTPGVFVLFNPESDANNDTTAVGVLRTTFSF
ncbi:iron uptake porin [Lyngbya aestuarii]|uniref:iron uptake porin n=1 Tax=Lyngbya aestuarii TaxID=118322 RepID=UPI00403DD7A4